MLRFFAPVVPARGRVHLDPAGALTIAVRVAPAALTPFDAVARWPWHKAVGLWAEARERDDRLYERTWDPLLRLWYKRDD